MTETPTLCLVEDDEIMGESLCDRFRLEGFDVDWHRSAGSALEAIPSRDAVAVISDIRLPDLSGEILYERLREQGKPLPPFVFITGYGSIDRAVHLLRQGAADYITKPFDLDALVEKIRALSISHVPKAATTATPPRLGVSAAMRSIEAMLPRLARQATTILITGESGVGKEVIAREIHRLDAATAGKPFVAVNCGALPETLLESELFGYEKGAFTGAMRLRRGVFEQADGGTLFLDEIGDMPPAMQVKLLRVIQDRVVVRLGGEAPVPVKLRLICATHRDLKKMVESGGFREDLFYRIHVINLKIPPLRERREDILWFAQLFLDEFAREHGGPRRVLHEGCRQMLLGYDWPGNLRELKHCLERACILSPDGELRPDAMFETDLGETGAGPGAPAPGLVAHLRECERAYILQALERQRWHLGHTADDLGISRKNLWEKMKKLGIESRKLTGHEFDQPSPVSGQGGPSPSD